MVEERLESMDEFQQIIDHIQNGNNFLLSGGAGSGKTYSLVQVIKQVIADFPTEKVACMTYTNAAVKEIEERVNHDNLQVTTIHDFLWESISHFQGELKETLIEIINDESIGNTTLNENIPIPKTYYDELEKGIQYKEYLRLNEGIISHDELLILANKIYAKYPKICDIIKDRFKFILIDEYQDTDPLVVEILLTHLKQSKKNNTIGFFGDAMQSIYDNTIGDLNDYIGEGEEQVREVEKKQNRRNPQKIIDLANTIRTDGLEQEPSEDPKAPNMQNGAIKQGHKYFIYSTSEDTSIVKNYLETTCRWNLSEMKELNLTHKLIASKAKIESLYAIYNGDKIIAFKDKVRRHIRDEKITDDFSEMTFKEVIEAIGIAPSGGQMSRFISENPELYNLALKQPWVTFSKEYVDKDQLIDDKKQDHYEESKKGSKRDNLIKHLFKIQNNIFLYENEQYNEFLRVTEKSINYAKDKIALKNAIESLKKVGSETIEQVIEKADSLGICKIDDKLKDFIEGKPYLYHRVKQVPFVEFQNLYNYLEGFTPFSTQHKIKGAEFNNVLVVLDNGGWPSYNFKYLFESTPNKESVITRTEKIFYVCCTRAKESLAVYYQNPSSQVLAKASEWFGSENVINLNQE